MRFAFVSYCIVRGSFYFSTPSPPHGGFTWGHRDGIHGPYVGHSVPDGVAVMPPRCLTGSTAFCHAVVNDMTPFATFVVRAARRMSDAADHSSDRHRLPVVLYDDRSAVAVYSELDVLADDAPRPAWWPDMSDEELEVLGSVIGS